MSGEGADSPQTGARERRPKLLLADRCPVSRLGMKEFLRLSRARAEVVGETGSAEEALNLAAGLQPDFVVVDPEFGPSGESAAQDATQEVVDVEVCRKLKALPRAPHVVAYTMHDSANGVAALLAAGVDSYVHKSLKYEELVEAKDSLKAGERVWKLGPASQNAELLARVDEYSVRLTPREREVFALLLSRYPNARIADRLYISLQTVKNHLGSIFRKCEVHSRRELFEKLYR